MGEEDTGEEEKQAWNTVEEGIEILEEKEATWGHFGASGSLGVGMGTLIGMKDCTRTSRLPSQGDTAPGSSSPGRGSKPGATSPTRVGLRTRFSSSLSVGVGEDTSTSRLPSQGNTMSGSRSPGRGSRPGTPSPARESQTTGSSQSMGEGLGTWTPRLPSQGGTSPGSCKAGLGSLSGSGYLSGRDLLSKLSSNLMQ